MEENIEQNIETTEKGYRKILKNKLVLAVIAVLALVMILGIGFIILNNYIYNEKQADSSDEMTSQNPVIYFEPSSIDLTSGQILIPIVKIMADLPNPADTIKIDIEYDTLTISEVQISQITEGESFLGTDSLVVTNTPNYQRGKAFFEIQTPHPVSGNGPIAILTFKPNPSSPVTTTTIKLTQSTSVSSSATSTNYTTAVMTLNVTLPSDSTDRTNFAPDAQERLRLQQESLSE